MGEVSSVRTNEDNYTQIGLAAREITQMHEEAKPLCDKFKMSVGDIIKICSYAGLMGINQLHALNGALYIVNGKVEISARTMSQVVLAKGHSLIVEESTDEVCVIRGVRRDKSGIVTEHLAKYTIQQAKRAGLLTRKTWAQYPEDMLYCRCLSRLCRRAFPDIVVDGVYVSGELADTADTVESRVVDSNPYDHEVESVNIKEYIVHEEEKHAETAQNERECEKTSDDTIKEEDDEFDPPEVPVEDLEKGSVTQIHLVKAIESCKDKCFVQKIVDYMNKTCVKGKKCSLENITHYVPLLNEMEMQRMLKRIEERNLEFEEEIRREFREIEIDGIS